MEGGIGFEYSGEHCDEDSERCTPATNLTENLSQNNYAHSVGIGMWNIEGKAACSKIAGFTIYNVHSMGIYFQSNWDTAVVEDVRVLDTPVGIMPILLGPGPDTHTMLMQSVSIKSSIFSGMSDSFDCSSYRTWQNLPWPASMALNQLFIQHPDGGARRQWIGMSDLQCWSIFNQFPTNPLDLPDASSNLYCQTCIIDTSFENYDNKCTDDPHFAISHTRAAHDSSGPITLISGNSFANTPEENRIRFLEPLVSRVNPGDCVDMTCDKQRRALVVDNEGIVKNSGSAEAFTGFTDFQYEGDLRYGLGDYRIPKTMLTTLNGSKIEAAEYAPFKGAVRADDCTFDENYQGYSCGNQKRYTYLIMESMDGDTEVRRLSPIAVRSKSGFIDLINGPADMTQCAGYACQVRISMFKMLVACNTEYDIHASSTLPKGIRFHMPYETEDCEVRVSLYMGRQNRMDVFNNGVFVPPMNTKSVGADGRLDYHLPDPSFIPELSGSPTSATSGSNYMDRRSEEIHFTINGGNVVDVETASSIIINLDVVLDLTVEEFYDTSDFPSYLAALLGVDQSMIRIVNVIPENARRKRRNSGLNAGITVEIGNPVNSTQTNENFEEDNTITTTAETITVTFSTEQGTTDSTTELVTTAEVTTSSSFSQSEIGNSFMDSVYNGGLQQALADSNMSVNENSEQSVQIQVAPETQVPEQSEPLWKQLGCTIEENEQGTCTALNELFNSESIETYSEKDEVLNEELAGQNQPVNVVVPNELVVVSRPTSDQLAGGKFNSDIIIGMNDVYGNKMGAVGLATDPWRVMIEVKNNENVFLDDSDNVAEFQFGGTNAGNAVFNNLGLKAAGGGVILNVVLIHPDILSDKPIEIVGMNVRGFESDGVCPSGEGFNPVSGKPFDKNVLWGDSCGSVCTLPCENESSDLKCLDENICDNEFMSCNGSGNITACECNDSLGEVALEDHVSVTCDTEKIVFRINKCVVNSKGFDLENLFMTGPDSVFDDQVGPRCFGRVDYSEAGVDYVWRTDFDQCGVFNNGSNHVSLLRSFTEIESGAANQLRIKASCDVETTENLVEVTESNMSITKIQESMDIAGLSSQEQTALESMSFIHRLRTDDFVDDYENFVIGNFTIANLRRDNVVKNVVQLESCHLSASPDASADSVADVVLNGCVVQESVELIKNSEGRTVRFSFGWDRAWSEDRDFTFIHCKLSVCDLNVESCMNVCE